MKYNHLLFAMSAMALVIFSSCSDDDTDIPNENEVITTVILELEDEATSTMIEFHWEDLDLDGTAEIEVEALAANTTYHGHIEILNELAEEEEEEDHEEEDDDHGHSHGADITEEIEEEADEHQIFYTVDPSTLATVEYEDEDSQGFPVGLEFELTTGDAGTGTLNVVLIHEPAKSDDVTLATAGGSTDFDVTFDLTVE